MMLRFDEVGPWTEVKLEIVTEYATFFAKVLKSYMPAIYRRSVPTPNAGPLAPEWNSDLLAPATSNSTQENPPASSR